MDRVNRVIPRISTRMWNAVVRKKMSCGKV